MENRKAIHYILKSHKDCAERDKRLISFVSGSASALLARAKKIANIDLPKRGGRHEKEKNCNGAFFVTMISIANAGDDLFPPSHGIQYPVGWQDWAVLAISHRTDNQTLRVILGNNTAIRAARSGRTNPWPDGAILGKVVWKKRQLKDWSEAFVPGELVHAEFMLKDSRKYSQTYGWGWARWLGPQQKPFNDGAQVCITCHEPVRERDWVFTDPAIFPKRP